MAAFRADVPVIHFDAIKLRSRWQQRPRAESDAALRQEIAKPAWILEGGPSLLPHAIGEADALVWLDPPNRVRAWRLATRPWKYFGRTRPELPPGNVDWPWQQYRFALRSLRNTARFRSYIAQVIHNADGLRTWHCRCDADLNTVLDAWSQTGR
nr:DNA topology modulation protein FlaR [Cognatishimia sp. F0-27]